MLEQYAPQAHQQAVKTEKAKIQTRRTANGSSSRRIPEDLRVTASDLSIFLGRSWGSNEHELAPQYKTSVAFIEPEKREDLKCSEVTLNRKPLFVACWREVFCRYLALGIKGVNLDVQILNDHLFFGHCVCIIPRHPLGGIFQDKFLIL